MALSTVAFGPYTAAESELMEISTVNGPEFVALADHLIIGARSGQVAPYVVI